MSCLSCGEQSNADAAASESEAPEAARQGLPKVMSEESYPGRFTVALRVSAVASGRQASFLLGALRSRRVLRLERNGRAEAG
jgi:hypothetical protein